MTYSYLVVIFALIIYGLFRIFDLSVADIFEEHEKRKTPKAADKRARITVDKKSWYARYKENLANTIAISKRLTWKSFMNILALLGGLGLFIGFLLDNILLGVVLMVIFPVIFSKWQKVRGSGYTRYLDSQVEDALAVITNHYAQSENLLMAVESSLVRLEDPLLSILTEFANDLRLGTNSIEALGELRTKVSNRYWREWIDIMIRCQDDRQCKPLLMPIIHKMSSVRKAQARLDTTMKSIWSQHIMITLLVFGVIPILRVMDKTWYDMLMHTPLGKGIIIFSVIDVFLATLYVLKINKPVSQEV